MTVGTFQRDGVALHYVDTGEGRPIVFQHGLGATARQVADIFPPLTAVRRITLECRGHGLSPAGPADRLSIPTFADDVVALCAALGIHRAVFGGISMGAAIAQRIAVAKPDLVEGLILVRPAWIDQDAPSNLLPFAEVGELLARHPPGPARELFLGGGTAAELGRSAPDNLASLLGMFDRPDPAATGSLLAAIANDGPGTTRGEIEKIAVPTLVIGNKVDFVHPLDTARRLHRLIRNSDFLEATPKATDPAAFRSEVMRAIDQFLGRLWHG